ncbi:substrate-binding domain-containing protein [Butyrivibrio sp. WCE2006]|uniref:substrate-binding domain-containing protein n=1 Tax=Butyrivibrio sp. WCE2006 TaxID=1410611 RepID=UPI0005D188A3|nr:substrate-binding domain-containing protein [Butyrivibrio sp. WCE2006]
MNKNRHLFFIGVTILLVLGIIVSAYSLVGGSSEDDVYNISVVVENSQSEKWTSFIAGAESAAADYNAIIDLVTTSEFENGDDEFSVIDDQIINGANAVVTELVSSEGTAESIKDISGKAVLALTGTDAQTDVDIEGKFATIAPDNYQIGRALGNEVLLRHQTGLSEKRIGIICNRITTNAAKERLNGLFDVLRVKKATAVWCIILDKKADTDKEPGNYEESENSGQTGRDFLQSFGLSGENIIENTLPEENGYLVKETYKEKPVDILVALDDESLQTSAEFFAEIENAFKTKSTAYKYETDKDGKLIRPIEIYGEGTSLRNISYLDRGKIVSMIVPNEFRMGYVAVEKAVAKLEHKLSPMEDETVEYRVINQESVFKDDNQKYLFTTMQ